MIPMSGYEEGGGFEENPPSFPAYHFFFWLKDPGSPYGTEGDGHKIVKNYTNFIKNSLLSQQFIKKSNKIKMNPKINELKNNELLLK